MGKLDRSLKSDMRSWLLLLGHPRVFVSVYTVLMTFVVGTYFLILYPLLGQLRKAEAPPLILEAFFRFRLWHVYLFVWEGIAFLVFVWLVLHYAAETYDADPQPPDMFPFEKLFGERYGKYYDPAIVALASILMLLDYTATGDLLSIFPMMVPAFGLFFFRRLFSSYHSLYKKYTGYFHDPQKSLISCGSTEKTSEIQRLYDYWRAVRTAAVLHFDHKYGIYNALVIVGFVIPAASLTYQDTGSALHSFLIGIEYYFIGMATWVSGLGAGIIYWMSTRLTPRTIHRSQDEYRLHSRAALLTIFTIALTPGVGVPAVAQPIEIAESPAIQSALLYLVVANVIVLTVSIFGIHRGMVKSRDELLFQLLGKLDSLEKEICEKIGKPRLSEEERKELAILGPSIEALQGTARDLHNMRVWPFRIELALSIGVSVLPVLWQVAVVALTLAGTKIPPG